MNNSGFESPTFSAESLSDYSFSSSREWLETNGLGGYCSSSLAGAHTRGYHGLLVAATHPPAIRHVLISRLDETLVVSGKSVELASRAYEGALTPAGHEYLTFFNQEVFPSFTYEAEGACIVKTITMLHGTTTVVISYDLMLTDRQDDEVMLSLRPFYAYRGYHERRSSNGEPLGYSHCDGQTLSFKTSTGLPDTYIHLKNSTWNEDPYWFYNFFYSVEAQRGLPCREDLFTPGTLTTRLKVGHPIHVLLSTDGVYPQNSAQLIEQERTRRESLFAAVTKRDTLTDILSRAADQFVVKRGDRGRTIIAGYPWFTDWGRDTMIALPGTCLVTKRFGDAKAILSAFADHIDSGLIPNRFPDIGEHPEYNTVDGTLWFFVAIWSYVRYSRDVEFASSKLLPALRDIISHHDAGTKFNIKTAPDGLLNAGNLETQLTWMDARANGVAVTPRHGKAVEINALWYNALCISGEICRLAGKPSDAALLHSRASKVRAAFIATFWSAETGYLYDCVNEHGKDASLRPNQLLALSLPFAVVEQNHATSILDHVTSKLLTPRGLRTLSPDAPQYRGRYSGDGFWRDSAYHQGTVWPWLLGPYLSALTKFDLEGAKKSLAYIRQFSAHLSEAGVGTVSEIFDGDSPWNPHGCMAQAWSVSEIFRVYMEDVMGQVPQPL